MTVDITNVEPMDSAKKSSDVAESLDGERTVILGEEKAMCLWNDAQFSEGSMVCDNGVKYKCHMGLWLKQKGGC